jgi:hypothetical protein
LLQFMHHMFLQFDKTTGPASQTIDNVQIPFKID